MSPPGSGTTPTPSTGGGVATPTTTSAQGDQTPGDPNSNRGRLLLAARPVTAPQQRIRKRLGACASPHDRLGRPMRRLPAYYSGAVNCAAKAALRDGIGRLPQFEVAVVSESQLVEWFLDGAEPPLCFEALPVNGPDGRQVGRVFVVRLDYVRGRLP